MATTARVPLNAEPSQPNEREKQHLEPKSYVDAVQEEPPANGTNGTSGTNSKGSKVTTESEWLQPSPAKASVLRIVDTGADGKDVDMDTEKEKTESRPQFERQESKNEYSAAVMFSPTLFCHLQALNSS